MNIRRALIFAWRMAVGYSRIALSLTLLFAGIIGLAVLGMVFVVVVSTGTSAPEYVFRYVVRYMAFFGLVLSVFWSVGLIWNVTGIALGMLIAPRELDLKDLRVTIPRNIMLYNCIGLPPIIMLLCWFAGLSLVTTVCWGMFVFLVSFIISGVAKQAWKKVVDWYELSEQGIKKKKNIPSVNKPKIETTEIEDADVYVADDDLARLRKSR